MNPDENIARAKELLSKEQRILGESRFIITRPLGFKAQPDFVNGAYLLETRLDIDDFRGSLKAIETDLGRTKGGDRCGPRPIDLDIVVWNGQIIGHDFYERDFVKKAVEELLPDLKY